MSEVDWNAIHRLAVPRGTGQPVAQRESHPAAPSNAEATFTSNGGISSVQYGEVGSQHWVDVIRERGTVVLKHVDAKGFGLSMFTADGIKLAGKAGGQPVTVTSPHDADRLDFVHTTKIGKDGLAITFYDRDIREVTTQGLQHFLKTGEFLNEPHEDHALHVKVTFADGAHFVTG